MFWLYQLHSYSLSAPHVFGLYNRSSSAQKTYLPLLADLILVRIQLPVFGVCPLTVIPHLVGLVVDLSDEILRVEVRILVKATQFEACFTFNVILTSQFIISFHRPHVEYGVSLSSG